MMATRDRVSRPVEGVDVVYLDLFFAPAGCTGVFISPTGSSASEAPNVVLLEGQLAFVRAPSSSAS